MSKKLEVYSAAKIVVASRSRWHEIISSDPDYIARSGKIYPYDTIGSNLDPIFKLFEETGFIKIFEGDNIKTICDIGCANGELSFAFARAGFAVTAIDYSFKHDQAPFVVAKIAQMESHPIAVIDKSVDGYFDFSDLVSASISDPGDVLPSSGRFDLIVCLGLVYHLRNPFAFFESIARVSRYVVVGTHIFTHTPQLRYRIDDSPIAYLVDSDELNHDPTNYWIFSEKAFSRLARRSGFEVMGSLIVPNNPLGVAVPDRIDLGVRNLLLLRSQI